VIETHILERNLGKVSIQGLTPVFLKNVEEISEPLAMIFNRSLDDGIVPQDLKMANVTPVFKRGQDMTLVITDQSVLLHT